MKRFCTIFLLAWLAAVSAQAGTLTATVDRTRLNHDETLALTLQYDADTDDEEPDTRALEQQFSIVSRNKAASISIVNGDASRTTSWYYELLPRKTGTLLVPSFSIQGDFSEAITIEVNSGPKTDAQARQNIYTETVIDKNSVYVQQQVVITWRLITRLNISDPKFMPPHIDGFLVQDLGHRIYQRASADGGVERVVEQRYALFPQQSGQLVIPAQQFQVAINTTRRSSMGIVHPGRNQLTLKTDPATLEVLPADNRQNAYWLPASALDISQEILGTDPQGRATAGIAFTRVVRIRAEGLSAEQLPAIDMSADGIRVYAEKPALSNEPATNSVTGQREERAAVIATHDGKLLLPAITVPWFDVQAGQWRSAVLPATPLEVLPGVATANPAPSAATASPVASNVPTAPPATDASTASPANAPLPATGKAMPDTWQLASAFLLLLLLGSAAYIYRLRQRMQSLPVNPPGFTANVTPTATRPPAVHSDLQRLHRELLSWAQQQPAHRQALQHPTIKPVIEALEKHLYGNGPAPDAAALRALPAQLETLLAADKTHHSKPAQLDTLYR